MAFVTGKTIGEVFLERVRKSAGKVAYRYRSTNEIYGPKGGWRDVTFLAFKQECEQTALGLRHLGLERGDRVAILSKTRYEWTLSDLAILGAGGVSVPIYPSSTTDEILYLLEHSDARFAFVEDEAQLMKILPRLEKLTKLKQVFVFESAKSTLPSNVLSLFDLQKEGEAERRTSPTFFEETLKSLAPEEPFTFCYTSGTTGTPKGAILTHSNLMSVLTDAAAVYGEHIREGKEVLLTFLPFSHIIGRLEAMSVFVFAWEMNFAESSEKIPENLREIRPTIVFAVPRLFEKALTELDRQLSHSSVFSRAAYRAAIGIGEKYFSKIRRGRSPGVIRRASYTLFRETVLSKVLEAFGGRLRFAICGGAPLPKDIGETFEILGILILEGYGLTETCAPITLNTIEKHKFGTVGRPLPDVTLKIASDGEILVRSRKVFKGYWKDEAGTQDAFDDEGWFKTGDIGFLDPQGYLNITDRKKDLIITSGGKNIAPQKIENLARTLSPLIADFVVVGDRRKHISALITLERTALRDFAKKELILYSSKEELTRHSKVQAEIERLIAILNQNLARFETVKRFAILPTVFSVESGELTPSLKVKRAVIERKYRDLINAMYQETPESADFPPAPRG